MSTDKITTTDLRLSHLRDWVEVQLKDESITQQIDRPIVLTPLGGDAGFRRYFRFQSPSQWLAVDAPPATEDSHQFVQLANELRKAGLTTPRIRSVDFENGWLLVEDFGDRLLINQASPTQTKESNFYSTSFASLLKLQRCTIETKLPRYDRELLNKELGIFCEWFVEKLLGYPPTQADTSIMDRMFLALIESGLEQPQVLVHRDFHSRNLICIDANTLGILDFQGAVWGPCTYDLVSLLRDCYLRWPADQVERWVLSYRELSIESGVLNAEISRETYLRWFDWMGLQRHIKVLGIFARLSLRDNKHHYLNDLPLVMRYVLDVCVKYHQFNDFYQLFIDKLIPLAQQQAWYQDWETAGDHL